MSDLKPMTKAVGRPREPMRSETVCTRVPVEMFDRLTRLATAERISVSAYVRRVLILDLDPKRNL